MVLTRGVGDVGGMRAAFWGDACGVLGGWLQRACAAFLCRGFTGGACGV